MTARIQLYTKNYRSFCLKISRPMPNLFYDFPCIFTSILLQLYPDYVPFLSAILSSFLRQLCPNYAPTIPDVVSSIPSTTMPQLCLNHDFCPNYAPTIPEVCPNYAPTMFLQVTVLPTYPV